MATRTSAVWTWHIPLALLCSSLSCTGSLATEAHVHRGNCGCKVVAHGASQQLLKIEPHGPNSIRVRAVAGRGVFRDDLVSALDPDFLGAARARQTCGLHTLEHDGPADVTNGNIKVHVGTDGKLVFTRVSDGKVLLKEQSVRVLLPTNTTPPVPGFFSLDLSFEATDGERIYGLGQHKTGKLDNKNAGKFSLAPVNTEVLIPVAHSSVGYAFLFNLPSFGSVEYSDTGSSWHADTAIQADFWVSTTGDSPPHTVSPWAQLQTSYGNVTGFAPAFPDWTSGFWQCKNRYHNQSQVLDVVEGYQSRDYPIQLIIIDYYSWNPDPLGDESLPKQCWPDAKQMVDTLHDAGVEVMISPYFHSVAENSKYFNAAKNGNFLVKDGTGAPAKVSYDDSYLYDLFQPGARAFAFAAVEAGYIKPYGIHHWWLDCDEPCGGDMTELLYNNGTWPASFVGAAYPHMVERMVYEGMGAPGKQYANDNVMLGRSSWAGSQKYGGAVWSGDTSSSFASLNQQFRAGLNMVMSGIPYWTTDIGGYNGGNISSPTFRELIVRWFQWGAFCPIFRNHGRRSGGPPEGDNAVCGRTGGSNEIWNFGNESEAAIARVMRIRDQLRPYVNQQYALAATEGIPIMRPLFFDFWDDAGALQVDDQLMFGPSYLVAPQLQQHADCRTVYLPKLPSGQVWRNYFTEKVYNTTTRGLNITEPTPLEGDGFGTFPLYYRMALSPYPPSPPPPPPPSPPGPPAPLPTCDNSCAITNSTERTSGHGGTLYKHMNSSSPALCCATCKADATCHAFVWGMMEYTTGPDTCFLLGSTVTGVNRHAGRSYGCVRK